MSYEVSHYNHGILIDVDHLIGYEAVNEVVNMAIDPSMTEVPGMPDAIIVSCSTDGDWDYTMQLFRVDGEWHMMHQDGTNAMTMSKTAINKENN